VSRGDGLGEQLARLRQRLAQRALEEAERGLREAEARQREADAREREGAQREQFARAVGPVHRVGASVRAARTRPPPPPLARQREADEARALASSLSDELDPATLLETDAGLAYCRAGIGADVLARLRRGQWSIQRHLDLHGLTRDAAREALSCFVRQAARDGLRCVRVVHGKGNGSPGREPVLKGKVRAWLVQKSEVIAFAQAGAADGGHGALLVLLRG
jgi:DNA-nicking Smr family endonuclease